MNSFFIGICLISFILRLAVISLGYHGDLNNQISWGNTVYKYGTVDFYERDDWDYSSPNQPPLTILMLGGLVTAWHFINDFFWYLNNSFKIFPSVIIWWWEQTGMILLMKLPSIIADVVIGIIIYKYLLFKKFNKKNALIISSIWLFNPIVWYNSSVWGQTDSIVNLFGILSVIFLLQRKLIYSFVFYTLSVLFKGSLLYFAPLLLAVAIFQNYKIKHWFKTFFICLFVVVSISVWFYPKVDIIFWLFNLFLNKFIPGEIGYLTANAFNFWWIIDSGMTLDSNSYIGIPARIWGFLIPSFVLVLFTYKLKIKISDKVLFSAFTVVAFTVFLFMTRIHERYLYPFFPYATLLLAFIPNLWLLYLTVSFIHLLNLYHLFWVPSFPLLQNLYTEQFKLILSVTNIILYILIFRLIFKKL